MKICKKLKTEKQTTRLLNKLKAICKKIKIFNKMKNKFKQSISSSFDNKTIKS